MDLLQYILGAFSGVLVGFTLGLIGGGGSVMGVPLMVYLVGVKNPHIAIGTSALAVAVNASMSLFNHARAKNVRWRCGGMYAAAGVVGALLGSTAGKAFDGKRLLFLFAIVMVMVGVLMLRGRHNSGTPNIQCTGAKAPKVLGFGLLTGMFSGFFGIGGGVLIVPGLVSALGMPILEAVGTSLIAVTAFGLTTAFNYALSGLIDWYLALVFIAGGAAGSLAGAHIARRLAGQKGQLTTVFAGVIFSVAAYVLWRSF